MSLRLVKGGWEILAQSLPSIHLLLMQSAGRRFSRISSR